MEELKKIGKPFVILLNTPRPHSTGAEQLCQELHCSQTMRAAVVQCVRYWTLADVDYQNVLDKMRADGELPCRDRREGKKRFEELKQRLL